MSRFSKKRTDDQPELLAAEVATVRAVMARTGDRRLPVLGAPCRCPECGEWGLVDESTPTATAHQCLACRHAWTITRRALAAVAAEAAPTRTPVPVTTPPARHLNPVPDPTPVTTGVLFDKPGTRERIANAAAVVVPFARIHPAVRAGHPCIPRAL